MRAYQLPQGTGIDALVKVDLPVPKPGSRQVLVKVAACSLNFRDLAIALGSYRMPTKPNIVPLSDGAGEVVEIGTSVSRVKVGDRVAGCFFQRWIGGPPAADTHTSALGGSIDGMPREYVVARHICRLNTNVRSHEPGHCGEQTKADHRQGLFVRRCTGGIPISAIGAAFREGGNPPRLMIRVR
jgi:threonine dehydrogenase-like Zn-dependent dehydrogenase